MNTNLLHKSVEFEVKEVSETGAFTGYAAVFNNVDLGGDVIAPGAFTKTIREKTNHPILWGHSPREVIGVNKSYREDAKGLYVEGQLVMGVARAKDARELMSAGAVTGLSIGYETVVEEFDWDTEIRTLKEVKLWEYSVVPFPMNPEAQIASVKSCDRFKQELDALVAYCDRYKGKLRPDVIALLEETEKKFSSLRAAQPTPQDGPAPNLVHASLSSIETLLSEGTSQ